jgi:hypothetical protein
MSQCAVKPHTQFLIVCGLLPQLVVMEVYKTEKKQEAGTQEIKK